MTTQTKPVQFATPKWVVNPKVLTVKIKKEHPDAVIPAYAKPGDAGLDLTAVTRHIDADGNEVLSTGLSFEIPEGYVGLLFPRSSNSKKDLLLTNSVGVIDSGFRGVVTMKFKSNFRIIRNLWLWKILNRFTKCNTDTHIYNVWLNHYRVGDRIGQLIILPYPTIQFEEVEELSETVRGVGGYGSTGN